MAAHRDRSLQPRDGLHLMIGFDEEGLYLVEGCALYRRKQGWPEEAEQREFLERCARLEQVAWMIDPWKCLDAPAKAIHSASPFCLAFKRASWRGGESYVGGTESKPALEQRIGAYFDRAAAFIAPTDLVAAGEMTRFRNFCRYDLMALLDSLPEFAEVKIKKKDNEYVVVYLAEQHCSQKKYKIIYSFYLREKLFKSVSPNHSRANLLVIN